jgi:hypothetical protein
VAFFLFNQQRKINTMKKTLILCLLLWAGIPAAQAQTPDPKTVMLESFGATSGMLVYNTYIVIGVIADSYEGEVYDSTEVSTYVIEQISAMENMARQYQALYDAAYLEDPADQDMVQEFVAVCGMLRDEAQALLDYIADPTIEKGTVFQEKRTSAWESIAYLLGIE